MNKIRIMLLVNNWVGWQIVKYLKDRKENIVALAIDEKKNQAFVKQIIKVSRLQKKQIFRAKSLEKAEVLAKIKKIKPNLVISAYCGYILKKEFIEIPNLGCINIHPGYLPFNRGKQPYIWPIVDGTSAGVTIHYINQRIDTGDIISRKQVKTSPIDTGRSIYVKTAFESVKLFKKIYPKFVAGKIKSIKQDDRQATFHLAKDADVAKKINLNKKYKARDLINLLRALTINDKDFAYYEENGKKIKISIKLGYIKNKKLI